MGHLIVGAGYTAEYLYQKLKKNSPTDKIYTLSRSESFLKNTYHFTANLDQPDSLQVITTITEEKLYIYYLAPPKPEGLIETRVSHFLKTLLQLSCNINIVYISTSGVYGNKNGDWVTEETPVNPETDRAKRRVSAEKQILDNVNNHAIVLRVPGIYGPGRLPIEKIKQRNKIIKEEECGYTNLIHVEDLAEVCITAAKNDNHGEIYNVSDTQPVKSSYYYKMVAKAAKLIAPEEVSYATALETFDRKRLSFLTESRRLNVTKMQNQLKPNLVFTDVYKGIIQSLSVD